ncbi:MAG TPA: CHAT domain-containing protein [Actinophytocola sp.]|uniref:CHAT domain-containing tetratricopeptide repeat protein n=1 Tax=Actinophytocola sp. TaxID=1872138 RepID=UPI002DB92C80|nr:CHAT domain-containing protein [Actinophytocola sp.]HEU5472708.1 CHAT domain-containing protein [Actinophytocola sp.]
MRDPLIASITARLARAEAQQVPGVVLAPGALLAAERLAEIARDDDDDLKARHVLGWFHWYRYLALSDGAAQGALDAACQALTPCFVAGIEQLPEPLLALLAEEATQTAHAWTEQVPTTTDLALVSAAIGLWQRILASIGADHPERAAYLANLAIVLRVSYERTGNHEDLEHAIRIGRHAAELCPSDHPDRAGILSNLSSTLLARFERAGNREDIQEAIGAARSAVACRPSDDPDRAAYLAVLCAGLLHNFRQTGITTNLDEGILAAKAAVEATPTSTPDHFKYLTNLAASYLERFTHLGSEADLNDAISVGRRAAEAIPAGDPDRVAVLSNLSAALRTRFTHTGASADLDEAISITRATIGTTPADNPWQVALLIQLGGALRTRFTRTGDLTDLAGAISNAREAIERMPRDHINFPRCLHNLGAALLNRFERLGDRADLDEAIDVARAAVDSAPADLPDRARMLSMLSGALRDRSQLTGTVTDLDEAISVARAAIDAAPPNHAERNSYLGNLSAALRIRFEHTGARTDLDQAISALREAVEAMPVGHSDRPGLLSMLGSALEIRFQRSGSAADLDEAIAVGRQAVHTAPVNQPDRANYLTILGNCLSTRFMRARAIADLDEAVMFGRQALDAAPTDHRLREAYLSNLAIALRFRAEHTGREADWEQAIALSRQAVATTPTDQPNYAERLINLGNVLNSRGTPAAREEAITTYIQAAALASGKPSVRLNAAQVAAALTTPTQAGRMSGLLETAVWLLPEVASLRLHRSDQQHALSKVAGLASDAAAAALAHEVAGEPPAVRALRLLELGRGVMLSLALGARSDVTDLRVRHPELADRFIHLRNLLDHIDTDASLAAGVTGFGQQAEDRHHVASAFHATIAEIRALEGYKAFLLPPEPAQMVRHAERGPIVVINVSRYRSDAILVQQQGVTSIALPDVGRDVLIDRIRTFYHALDSAHEPGSNPEQRRHAQEMIHEVLAWLWDAAAKPILDELGYCHTPEPGAAWPRLWWASGGIMGFLPIHAAGHHAEARGACDRPTVMDRVISSYTPTIRALGYARECDTAMTAPEQALIVAMPTTPGEHSHLPYAGMEADLVHAHLPSATLLIENSAADAQLPTKTAVLAHLRECAIAHFACHGGSDPDDPSQSRLLLHDHDTDPLTVASLVPIQLEHAKLAYLSACHTAFNPSFDLADEAIHLTTAFQLAGYPHVVGTLWQISDQLAIRIADAFYAAITTHDNRIDTNTAAEAIHRAVRVIRDKLPTTPSLWAAYLHAGT